MDKDEKPLKPSEKENPEKENRDEVFICKKHGEIPIGMTVLIGDTRYCAKCIKEHYSRYPIVNVAMPMPKKATQK